MGKWIAGVLAAVVAGVILIYVTDFLKNDPPPLPLPDEFDPPAGVPENQEVKVTSYSVEPISVSRDELFYVDLTLTNEGADSSLPMRVRVRAYSLEDADGSGVVLIQDGGGELVAEEDIEPIEGHADLSIRIRCTAPLAAGRYDLSLSFTARDDDRRFDLIGSRASNFIEVQ